MRKHTATVPAAIFRDPGFLRLSTLARLTWLGLLILGESMPTPYQFLSPMGEPLAVYDLRSALGVPRSREEEFGYALDELAEAGALLRGDAVEPYEIGPEFWGYQGVPHSARPSAVRGRVARSRERKATEAPQSGGVH